jgi:protein-L-isoaspartate O-methyltransferase
VLAELASRVYSVESIDELAQRAIRRFKEQGYKNVEVRIGNGCTGWPEHAPYDKVIVAAQALGRPLAWGPNVQRLAGSTTTIVPTLTRL